MRLNDTKLVYLCIKGYTSIFGFTCFTFEYISSTNIHYLLKQNSQVSQT